MELLKLELLYNHYLGELTSISTTQSPQVKRILMEELAESIFDLPQSYRMKGENERFQKKIWRYYTLGVKSGMIYDEYYMRYSKSQSIANTILAHPYFEDCNSHDYKSQRYEYALSVHSVPQWVMDADSLFFLEELITANLYGWYCSRDWYYENLILKRGA